jgi:acyl-CoA synthetase (AMP-forming)/AMP-acid ligase II
VDRLAAHGGATALVEDGAVTTYAELAGAVRERAATLGDGRRLVLLVAEPTRESVVTYLAALQAGHVVLLAPPDRPGAVEALLGAYRPDVVVAGGGLPERVAAEPQHDLHPDLALLLSTSGSTGSPKLVRLSHDNLASNAEAVAASLGLGGADVGVTTLPLSYCYGLSVLHSHLAVGAAVLLTRLSVVDPCFVEQARAAGVTSLPGVPYTFDLLDRAGYDVLDLPSLRLVTQAGGRLAPDRVRALAHEARRRGSELVVMYGQTEATARMTCLPPGLAAERPGSVGVPVAGSRVRVDPVPGRDDGAGELVFEGPGVMLGYATTPADLALGRTVTELRTGDLARVDRDGMVEIVGRAGRFAKVFGTRIDLAHAEDLLARHGFVTSVVELDGTVLVAVEGDHDAGWVARLAAEDLGLPRHAVAAVAVPALPRGGAGKVDAAAVRALAPAPPSTPAPATGPGDAGREPDVRALFAEVLERPDARPGDTFVGLGGDSLSYVAVSVQLERLLGHLPPAWHVTPIERLRPRRRRVRWLRQVETGVVLRAVAAVLIVATHVGVLAVPGSAHVLLALAGYNFARFRLDDRPRGDRVRGTLLSVLRLALPSVLWIALAALLVTDAYGPLNVVLLNHVLGTETWDTSWHFWFVEVLVWTLVGVALLVAVPAVDRLERRAPFALALAVLAAGLTARFDLLPVDPVHPQPVLWLFALGWAAARAAHRWQQVAVTLAAVLCVPGFFGDPQRDAVILVGVLLVLWVPTLPVPAPVAPLLATLAGASLFVYLTHWQVYPVLRPVDPWLAVGASLLVGVAYARLGGAATAAVERRTAQLVARVRPPATDRPREATSTPPTVPTTSATASRQSPVRSGTR